MKTWYFTFGRESRFPFQNGYITIEAPTARAAYEIFDCYFPPRVEGSDISNFSFCYSEEEWAIVFNHTTRLMECHLHIGPYGKLRKEEQEEQVNEEDQGHDPVLCGFVYCNGKEDFSAWEVQLPKDIRDRIDAILDPYRNEGTSVRSAWDEKLSDVFSPEYPE